MGGDTVDMGGQSRRPWSRQSSQREGPSGNWDLGMREALPVGAKALTVSRGGGSQQPQSANSPPSAGPAAVQTERVLQTARVC